MWLNWCLTGRIDLATDAAGVLCSSSLTVLDHSCVLLKCLTVLHNSCVLLKCLTVLHNSCVLLVELCDWLNVIWVMGLWQPCGAARGIGRGDCHYNPRSGLDERQSRRIPSEQCHGSGCTRPVRAICAMHRSPLACSLHASNHSLSAMHARLQLIHLCFAAVTSKKPNLRMNFLYLEGAETEYKLAVPICVEQQT